MIHLQSYSDWERIQNTNSNLDLIKINEGEISDALHTIGDFVSVASDLVVPGSGAVIDIIQAITYFSEAALDKNEISASASTISGIVSLGSLVLVGPMQVLASKIKSSITSIKNGILKGTNPTLIQKAREASAEVIKFLEWIKGNSVSLGNKLIELLKSAKESKLGNWIISKFGSVDKFTSWCLNFFKERVPFMIKKFAGIIGRLNPKSTSGAIDDLTIKNYSNKYTREETLEDKAKELIQKKEEEIKKSGISPGLKYVKEIKVPDNVKYQQDSTKGYK